MKLSKKGNDANSGKAPYFWRTLKHARLAAGIILLVMLCFACSAQAQGGPTFFYVVTTVDTNGFESAFSTQATATFAQGQSKATLGWTAATVPTGGAPIAGYNVYRAKVTGGPYTKINASLVTVVTYVDQFVLPNAPSGLVAPVS